MGLPTCPRGWGRRNWHRAASSGCGRNGASRTQAITCTIRAGASHRPPSPWWSRLCATALRNKVRGREGSWPVPLRRHRLRDGGEARRRQYLPLPRRAHAVGRGLPRANSTVNGLVESGLGPAPNPPAIPSSIAGCSDPLSRFTNTTILPTAAATLPAAAFFESLPGPVQVINNLVGQGPTHLPAPHPPPPPLLTTDQTRTHL